MKFGSSSAVNAHRPSPTGFYDTYGNVWEWSEEYFRPFAGFHPDKLYWDFSGGCFD
jgi:formylglycine-generating enzyme required for sulfatase activity